VTTFDYFLYLYFIVFLLIILTQFFTIIEADILQHHTLLNGLIALQIQQDLSAVK